MSKVKPTSLIQSISGKITRSDKVYFSVNRRSGKIHTQEFVPPSVPPSERQVASRTAFAQRTAAVSQWINANRPTPDCPDGTPDYRRAYRDFSRQTDIGNFFAYCSRHLVADGTIMLDGEQ